MMRAAIALLCLLFIFFSVRAQKEDPVQTLIKAATFLEEKPLDKDAKAVRGWAIQWIIETDKVTVQICASILGVSDKYKYSSELIGQYTIGMAAFKLANPDKARDESAAQLAGIESALRSYEAITKEKPKATDSFIDQLLAKRAANSLAQYLVENNCKDKK